MININIKLLTKELIVATHLISIVAHFVAPSTAQSLALPAPRRRSGRRSKRPDSTSVSAPGCPLRGVGDVGWALGKWCRLTLVDVDWWFMLVNVG